MSDINTTFENDIDAATTTAPGNDSFELLAQDLMHAFTALVTAVVDFSQINASPLGTALGIVGDHASALGASLALRGMVLAGEVSSEEADMLVDAFGGNKPSEIDDALDEAIDEYLAPETDAA